MNAGDVKQAFAWRNSLVALEPDDRNALWDLITTASAAQEWAVVRDIAAKLEIEVARGDGPIDEKWGRIQVEFTEPDGKKALHPAMRTGPATAKITFPANPGQAQHFGDWVALDMELIEPAPEDAEERQNFLPSFRSVYVIESGGYGPTCFVDGVDPGDEAFDVLESTLDDMGWRCWTYSDSDYTVFDNEQQESLPGRYFTVVAPLSVSPAEMDRTLKSLTASWPYAVCWLYFAQMHNLSLDEHTAISERFNL
jgi:hypothetical protein